MGSLCSHSIRTPDTMRWAAVIDQWSDDLLAGHWKAGVLYGKHPHCWRWIWDRSATVRGVRHPPWGAGHRGGDLPSTVGSANVRTLGYVWSRSVAEIAELPGGTPTGHPAACSSIHIGIGTIGCILSWPTSLGEEQIIQDSTWQGRAWVPLAHRGP